MQQQPILVVFTTLSSQKARHLGDINVLKPQGKDVVVAVHFNMYCTSVLSWWMGCSGSSVSLHSTGASVVILLNRIIN